MTFEEKLADLKLTDIYMKSPEISQRYAIRDGTAEKVFFFSMILVEVS